MSLAGKRFYDFSRFRIDLTEGVLLRDGEIVPITPKAFELLRVLVENGGHVLSKQDLLRQVWPDTFVEEGNLAFNVSQLRKVLSQNGDRTLFIETVPRRGYRFAPSVTKVNDELPLTATTHVPGSKVWLITSLAAVLVIAGGLVAWSLLVPQASPRALRTRQVSHFGRASGELATD